MGKTCVVELVVRASKHESNRHISHLDSETDYRDPKNLAVVISETNLPKCVQASIKDPSVYYRGKRLRVSGKVVFGDERYQMHVKSPEEIERVDFP